MALAILVSTFGCNNGLILSGARIYYAMAKDRLFFQSAGHREPASRSGPWRSSCNASGPPCCVFREPTASCSIF